jgi:hypothetical protein
VDIGEAPAVIFPSPRSDTMSEPTRIRKRRPLAPPTPHQKILAFESGRTRGLTAAERLKVVKQLAQILMLAAGTSIRETDGER